MLNEIINKGIYYEIEHGGFFVGPPCSISAEAIISEGFILSEFVKNL
jgi:hypothetical protein